MILAAVIAHLSPGEANRGWSNYQQWPLFPVVGCNTDGLYRFPQAHIISQEQTTFSGHCKAVFITKIYTHCTIYIICRK